MARHHLTCAPRRRRTRARRPDARPRRRACIPLTDQRMRVPGGSSAQEAASGVMRRRRGRCSLVWQRARGELARKVIKNDNVRLGLWIPRFQDGHSPKECIDRLKDAKWCRARRRFTRRTASSTTPCRGSIQSAGASAASGCAQAHSLRGSSNVSGDKTKITPTKAGDKSQGARVPENGGSDRPTGLKGCLLQT